MNKFIKIVIVVAGLLLCGCQTSYQTVSTQESQAIKNDATGLIVIENRIDNSDEIIDSINDNENFKTNDDQVIVDNSRANSTNINDNIKEEISQVTISIECTTLLNNRDKIKDSYRSLIPDSGFVLKSVVIKIENGMSVLDVLNQVCKENAITVKTSGGYIKEIAYLPEKILTDINDRSGWMYSVNGKYVNTSADKKIVSSGDVIKWMYTCTGGNDLSWS